MRTDVATGEAAHAVEQDRGTSDVRTFLIADVRGYTRFTQEQGDEEGGALAARFAALARETVAAHDGEVLELRGDEALCVFASARRALRAAVDLQVRFRSDTEDRAAFPLGIGIGLDAGEAVPIEGGFRGSALNVAARLCALAKPGEILASEMVVGLAGRLDGVKFARRRPVRLKGIERPVRVIEIVPEAPLPSIPVPASRRRLERRWLIGATVALITLVGGLVALGVNRVTRPHGLPALTPNSVGIIDAESGRIANDLLIGGRPSAAAVGGGSVWVTNSADGTVDRIDTTTHDRRTIDVGAGPAAIAYSNGIAWVANSLDRTVSEISAETNKLVQNFTVGNGPRAVAVGAGAVWVANGVDGTVSRIDPAKGRVTRTILVGANPSGVAVAEGSVWVTTEATGTVLRLDPSGEILKTVNVGNAPSAISSGEGALWVTNAQDGTVSRIDPVAAVVTGLVSAGRNPRAVAAGSGAVWVANADDGTLTKIDANSRTVQKTVRLASSPTALVVAGDSVWATAVSEQATHRGGTLRLAFEDMGNTWVCDCFDPNRVWSAPAWGLMTSVYDGLVGYRRVAGTQGGSLVPDLARAVPVPTDGGRTYTFQLREGIRFSNGRPLRASDVAATFERIYRLSFGRDIYAGIIGAQACIDDPARCDLSRGIEADDETGTIVVHLAEPDPDFLFKLALPFTSVVPAESPMKIASQLPGTGPYKVAAFSSDELRLVRNPYFRVWSQDAQPAGYSDEIQARFGGSSASHIEAVTTGAADYASDLPPGRLADLARRYSGQLHADPLAWTRYVFLRVTLPPFDDPRVRQALNYAVDRRRIVDMVGGPLVAQPTCQMLPPNFPGYEPYCPYTLEPNPAGTWTAPDIAKATRLIAESGTKGMPVRVIADAADPERAAIGRYFTRLLRELGYDASVKVFDADHFGDFWEYVYGHGERVQLAVTGWQADYVTPANFLFQFACPPLLGSMNDSEFCDAGIDGLMRRSVKAQTQEPAAALPLWAAVDRAVADEAPAVFLANYRGVVLVSKRAGNFQAHPVYGPLLDQLWVQ
jgi:YVTN family beta-propeller protein